LCRKEGAHGQRDRHRQAHRRPTRRAQSRAAGRHSHLGDATAPLAKCSRRSRSARQMKKARKRPDPMGTFCSGQKRSPSRHVLRRKTIGLMSRGDNLVANFLCRTRRTMIQVACQVAPNKASGNGPAARDFRLVDTAASGRGDKRRLFRPSSVNKPKPGMLGGPI